MSRSTCRQRPPNPRINIHAPLAKGLKLWWGCGSPHATQASDPSMFGNHGTLTNMDPPTDWVWDTTLNRFVMDFDGSNDYVTLGKSMSAAICSMAIWGKSTAAANDMAIADCDFNLDRRGVGINFDMQSTRQIRVQASNTTTYTNAVSGASTVTASAWTHACGTVNSAALKCYVGGQCKATEASPTVPAGQIYALRMGADGQGGFLFTGQLTDGMVWDRVLCDSEVQQLADPSNVMLSGLLLPPTRKLWPVVSAAGLGYSPWIHGLAHMNGGFA